MDGCVGVCGCVRVWVCTCVCVRVFCMQLCGYEVFPFCIVLNPFMVHYS